MDEDLKDGEAGQIQHPDRRQVLKRGAVLGGAVVWATPVVQAVSVRVADAASGETPPPPPPPPASPPPPPPAPPGLPSHGFFLLHCEGVYYGYQVIGEESDLKVGSVMSPEYLGSPGKGNDVPYWNSLGYWDIVITDGAKGSKKWRDIKTAIGAGQGAYNGGTALFLSSIPTSCALVNAFVWDGSFQTDPDGDKVRQAVNVDGRYYFYK